MSQIPRVPIPERGGRLFPTGTVYYSNQEKGFLAAGSESEGVLPVSAVSGRVGYSVSSTGVVRFRDETGQFIRTGSFLANSGTQFGHGLLNVTDAKVRGIVPGDTPGPDGQFIERTTILKPNGKVEVIEIHHGIGGEFDPDKQAKQWWRKVKEAMSEDGETATYSEVKAAIVTREVILRLNLGPL